MEIIFLEKSRKLLKKLSRNFIETRHGGGGGF